MKLNAITVDGDTYISNDPNESSEQMLAQYLKQGNIIKDHNSVRLHHIFKVDRPKPEPKPQPKRTAQQVDTLAQLQAAFITWYLNWHDIPKVMHDQHELVTKHFQLMDNHNGFDRNDKDSLSGDWKQITTAFSIPLLIELLERVDDNHVQVEAMIQLLRDITGTQL